MRFSDRHVQVDTDCYLFRIYEEDENLTHQEVIHLWECDAEFVQFYSSLLLKLGFMGFCWEMPPITASSLSESHEFVVIKSMAHEAIRPDPSAFAEHFNTLALAVAFPNLGKNGIMIAPTPQAGLDAGSISSFIKTASAEQLTSIWSLVAKEVNKQVGDAPTWVSTAGLGVSWLHIRIDTKPKYYRYKPYKN